MLRAFDGRFDVILLLCFLKHRFCKLVALRVEREPLAIGKNGVAASDALFHERTFLEPLQPRYNAEIDKAYGVPRAGKQRNHLLQKKYRVKVVAAEDLR
jgi:hypothetical protein